MPRWFAAHHDPAAPWPHSGPASSTSGTTAGSTCRRPPGRSTSRSSAVTTRVSASPARTSGRRPAGRPGSATATGGRRHQGGGAVLGHATCLALMAACLLATPAPGAGPQRQVHRRPGWRSAVVPVFLVFNLWDWVAIRRGHWAYSPHPHRHRAARPAAGGAGLLRGRPHLRAAHLPGRRPPAPSGPAGGAAVIPEYSMASACGVASPSCWRSWSCAPACSATPATGSPWPSWPPSSCW